MKEKPFKLAEHHRYGIRGLKKIHEADRWLLPLSAAQSILTALFPYIELYLSTLIIDALIGREFDKAPVLIGLLVLMNLAAGLLIDLLNQVNTFRADRVHREMLKLINKKAMELDYEEMEDAGLLQKISDAIYVMEHIGGYNVFIMYYRQMAENVIQILTSFVMIVTLCLRLPAAGETGVVALVASVPGSLALILLVTAVNIVSSRYLSKRYKSYGAKGYHEKMKVERVLNYYTDEVFMNYSMGKDVRLFRMLDLILGRHREALDESIGFFDKYLYRPAKQKETWSAVIHSVYTFGAYVVVMAKVLAKGITIGELSKYIGAIHLLNKALADVIDVNYKISLQAEFVKSFDEFLAIENAKSSGKRGISLDKNAPCRIEFHNVSFRYKNSQEATLKHISCKIDAGSKIAVVGKNGAGKTTFIKLICRLYEPTEGYISLNGVDIREYNYEEYMDLFSVVFQDFRLFSFPIGENIAAGRTFDRQKVWDSLEMAGVAGAVRRLPGQLDTNLHKLDEDGVNVSGGEAQKMAIARALYKDAPIVVLDEPTAALDPISEYEIFSSFNDMVEGKTSLFISHRMGSCRFCDEIFVFDEGRIVSHGSHEELILQKGGLYAELYGAQAEYYTRETKSM